MICVLQFGFKVGGGGGEEVEWTVEKATKTSETTITRRRLIESDLKEDMIVLMLIEVNEDLQD